jgi:glycosyltransferase involved in cell wall biosynthesis
MSELMRFAQDIDALARRSRAVAAELARFAKRVATPCSVSARETWQVEGPFDSFYSLAVVNREFARALRRAGENVALVSRDGPGEYPANIEFLADNPDLAEMVEHGWTAGTPAVALRFQYPPHVRDMRGGLCVLANYAWEESGFPAPWVREFNNSLDLITVLSEYVAKLLRDNGVRVPICVTGAGVEQIMSGSDTAVVPARRLESSPFRFLHVSSGFPRKGVDVLLAAWAAAFKRPDDVELIIKTFPNIHNDVERLLTDFASRYPNAAPISLINHDIDTTAMRALYFGADAVVNPTRGEGFGLPMAEAQALGVPVITTGFGGHTDFCTNETAWLCDYRFAPARTHLDVADSVWVEPDVASFANAMREVRDDPHERARRASAGLALIRSRFTWDEVARRTREAVAAIRLASPHRDRLPVIGVVSPWHRDCAPTNETCMLLSAIDPSRWRIFADGAIDLADESFVVRCWSSRDGDPPRALFEAIRSADVDALLLRADCCSPSLVARLPKELAAAGIPTFIMLPDLAAPGHEVDARTIRPALLAARRVLVRTVNDMNRLKELGVVDNVALLPRCAPAAPVSDWLALSERVDGLIRGELNAVRPRAGAGA